MKTTFQMLVAIAGVLTFTGAATLSVAQAAERTFTLQDSIDRAWLNELVHYDVQARAGEIWPNGVRLRDEVGKAVPVQLAEVSTHPDGSVKAAQAWFIVSLPAGSKRAFVLTGGKKGDAPMRYPGDLAVQREDGSAVLSNSKIAVRVLSGERKYASAPTAGQLPAPIQSVRLQSGKWTGRGWFETAHRAISHAARISDDGPVFKRAVIEYSFARPPGWSRERDPFYRITIQVVSGQPLASVTEEYNLGDPKVYQEPKFQSERQEMLWDWWSWRPHEAKDNFVFSFYGAFQPTHARTVAHSVTTPEKGKSTSGREEDEYRLLFDKERFEFALNARGGGWTPDQALYYTLYRPDEPRGDVLAILPSRPGRWRNPDMLPHEPAFINQHTDTASLRVYSSPKPDLLIRAPLHLGRREWAIAALQNTDIVSGKTVDTPIAALSRKLTWPLDKIKDWTLEWKQTAAYPHLFIKAGDLAGLRTRIAALPALQESLRKEQHIAVHRYLLDGKAEDLQKAYEDLVKALDEKTGDVLAWSGGERVSINSFPWHLQTISAQADVVLADPGLSREKRDGLLSRLAFLNYVLRDDDYLPPRKAGYGWGSLNMPVNVGGARAILASLLSDHPQSSDWIESSKTYFGYVIENYYGKDGSPYSGPHYMITEGGPVVTTLLALQNTGRMGDIKTTYPSLHAYGKYLVDMTTPEDVRFGQRLLPTEGDSHWEGNPLAGQFAPLFKTGDPALAENLMWTWLQSGKPLSGFINAAYFFDPTIPTRAPKLQSVAYPGYGAFLRSGAGTPQESYVQIRFGDFTVDHVHNDAGSLHWYARGVPLSLDFASMYTPHTSQPQWHSTLSYNHREHVAPVQCPGGGKPGHPDCFYTGKSWYDHQFEPHTALSPIADQAGDSITEMHGKIAAFASQPGADYVRGTARREWFETQPYFYKEEGAPGPWTANTEFDKVQLKAPFNWTRHFVFVKDEKPDGPNYMVISDDLSGNREVEPAFNFWCLANDVKASGEREYSFSGQHGLDLDMFVLEPKAGRVQTGQWSHTQSFLTGQPKEEKQHFVRAYGPKNGGGFQVVLFPRKPNEPKPTIERLQDGKVIKVSLPDQTHWIVLSTQPVTISDGNVKFTGATSVVKRWKNGREQVIRLSAQ